MSKQRGTLTLLTLVLAGGMAFGHELPVGHDLHMSTHPIMHFSREWMREHRRRRASMPVRRASQEQVAALLLPVPGDTMGINLLPNLNFNSCGGQNGWNQGQCGNCWVWGSTAACSINAGVALGTPQLFSTQWFDSDYYATQGNASVCDGGDTSMFASFYSSYPKFIPWTNSNAGYADGNGPSSPATSASAISQTPNVSINSISASQIATAGETQAQAIANIKSVLDANQAVVLAFFLPSAGWTDFDNAWENNSETTPWAGVDSYNGTTMDSGGGGHLVCVVGYDNTNNSWVVLNSWGPTNGRPDGYFELSQSMGYNDTMDYDGTMNQYEFDTYEITGWGGVVTAPTITTQPSSQTVNVGQSGKFSVVAAGSAPLSYQWFHNGTAISGATYATYTTPVSTSANNGDSYDVTVSNASGTATSSSATLTVTASALTNLIVNGGFEGGATGWTAAPDIIGQAGSQEPAYAGTWAAWFGAGARAWNTVAQTVAIPATDHSAALSFFLHIDTRAKAGSAVNPFLAQVRDLESGKLTTLASFSNLDAASGYQQHTYNLSAYLGRSIQVSFSCAQESTSYLTSFVLDNVSLNCR